MAITYHLDLNSREISVQTGADTGLDAWEGGALQIGQFAPVIVRAGKTGGRVLRPMHWGYPAPGQSTEFAAPGSMRWVGHVRHLDSPFWIGNLRHIQLRCLFPVSAIRVHDPKRKITVSGRSRTGSLFTVAAIWRDLTDMPVCAMIVAEANAAIRSELAPLEPSSLPVVIKAEDRARWLGGEWSEAKTLVDSAIDTEWVWERIE